MTLPNSWKPYAAVLAGLALAVLYAKHTIGSAAASAANAVNPNSADNLAYSGVNAVGATVTSDPNFSLGGAIYDWTHPAIGAAVKNLTAGTNASGAPASQAPYQPSGEKSLFSMLFN